MDLGVGEEPSTAHLFCLILSVLFLENGKKLYAFFVDYSKAFDFVVHDNLWYKLLKLGLRGKIIHIPVWKQKCSIVVKSPNRLNANWV